MELLHANVDHDPSEIFAILHDEYSRAILEATVEGPKSGEQLSEECNMSRATVSRRVNNLVENGLLVERTQADPDGHHYTEYEAILDHIDIRLDRAGFTVNVDTQESAADRFTSLWEDMRKD